MKTLAMGLVTFALTTLLSSCAVAAGKAATPAPQVIAIAVTSDGFVPAEAKAKAGTPVKLVVTRKTDRTCATEIVIKAFGVKQPLPLNQAVEVTFTPSKPGRVRFACAMDMIAGAIVVE
ncbi:MAG: cupredoxin domain-containing protein [Myxococcota bacterium]